MKSLNSNQLIYTTHLKYFWSVHEHSFYVKKKDKFNDIPKPDFTCNDGFENQSDILIFILLSVLSMHIMHGWTMLKDIYLERYLSER